MDTIMRFNHLLMKILEFVMAVKNKLRTALVIIEDKRFEHLLIHIMIIGIIFVVTLLFTLKKDEPFTELYFYKHQNLPKEIELHKTYPFYFTIHNYEYKRVKYIYSINVSSYAIDTGEVTLDHDQSVTIVKSFMISESVEMAKVSVKLENRDQEIHFWIEGKGGISRAYDK